MTCDTKPGDDHLHSTGTDVSHFQSGCDQLFDEKLVPQLRWVITPITQ